MTGLGHRRAHAGLVLSLGVVERALLGPVIDVLRLEDDPRLPVYELALVGADEIVLVDASASSVSTSGPSGPSRPPSQCRTAPLVPSESVFVFRNYIMEFSADPNNNFFQPYRVIMPREGRYTVENVTM